MDGPKPSNIRRGKSPKRLLRAFNPRVERFGFQFVCVGCLTYHGVLDAPALPDECPVCGLRDPWAGPIARTRFSTDDRETMLDSPFYVAARRRANPS